MRLIGEQHISSLTAFFESLRDECKAARGAGQALQRVLGRGWCGQQ